MIQLRHMWERVNKTSRLVKARKLVSYGLTALVAVFLTFFLISTPTSAADASLSGAVINYESNQYVGPVVAKENEIPSVPAGASYYTYVETVTARPLTQKAHIIYFSTGQDPGSQKSATYLVYDLKGKTFSNPSGQKIITIEQTGGTTQASSCSVSGIGWIICPVSNFLATGMDWVFSILEGFITVPPINVDMSDPNNGLFIAWNVMRGFANAAFIIAFLLIIYAQITGYGLSTYSVKKMLPRLLVAAILVNLSFIICALGVDISNQLGHALQDLFMNIRDQVFHMDNSWAGDDLTWENVTSAVLGGSAAGLATAIGIGSLVAASGGSIAGMVFLLLPVLLGLFLTVLMVLLILAARQALIVILIIVAPLAFVANLLPNTEKWYEKWQSSLMTMLIFFPAFSVVFGGSQLAGSVIIQNANSMLMVVLGMMVQVAPLVITPFLLKFSGGVVGKVAGIVNNPRKGLIDRTRGFAKDRAEYHKYRNISRPLTGKNVLSRTARNMEYRRGRNARRTDFMKQRYAGYEARRRYSNPFDQQLEIDTRNVKADNKNIEDTFDLAYEEMKAGNATSMQAMRAAPSRGEAVRDRVRNRFGQETIRIISQTAINRTIELDQETRIIASAKTSAQNIQAQNYANLVNNSRPVRIRAGGIDTENGENRALANALAAIDKARKEARANVKVIYTEHNFTADDMFDAASGVSNRIRNTAETQAAALEVIFGGKDKGSIATAYENIDLSFANIPDPETREMLRIIVGEAIMAGSRAPWVGGGTVAKLKQGLAWDGSPLAGPYGEYGVDSAIIKAIKDSVIDANTLSEMGTRYLGQLTRAVVNRQAELTPEDRARLVNAITVALDPHSPTSLQLGDSEPVLRNLLALL